MRVLLTGATGFIGRQCLTPLREAGHRVIALARGPTAADETIAADLLEPPQIGAALRQAQADALLHLAWYGGPDRISAPANLEWAAATLRLVQSFCEHGGKRVVGVGSCAEYDWSDPVLHESTPLLPASLYGAAKASTALALTGASASLGVSLAWARLFFCYGPGAAPSYRLGGLIPDRSAANGPDLGGDLNARDILHSADIGRALVAILDSGVTGPINVGSGAATSTQEIIAAVTRQAGDPAVAVNSGPAHATGRHAEIIADVTRLRREVGFAPRIDLQKGVAMVLADARP